MPYGTLFRCKGSLRIRENVMVQVLAGDYACLCTVSIPLVSHHTGFTLDRNSFYPS